MATTQSIRTVLFSTEHRSASPRPTVPPPTETHEPVVLPALPEPAAYEQRLRSVSYGTEVAAFHYARLEIFPVLESWLHRHACKDVVRDGNYVTFTHVRAARLRESRLAVGNYVLVVGAGPLKGTVQTGDANDVARLYRPVDATPYTGEFAQDPEQLLLETTDDTYRQVLERLIAAEGLLQRNGHEEWCRQVRDTADACTCGYGELLATWCHASGTDPDQYVRGWRRSSLPSAAQPTPVRPSATEGD